MPNQTEHGKAFEYACLKGLEGTIATFGQGLTCNLVDNISYKNAKDNFDNLTVHAHKELLLKAGLVMASRLKDLEPRLIYPVKGFKDIITLEIQPDKKGIEGDVRDVLAIRIFMKSEKNNWELGISCKHNHYDLKHPRISPRIDIGKQWLKLDSSKLYLNNISLIFLKLDSVKNSGVTSWAGITNKDTLIYKPLMDEIKNEILRQSSTHEAIACSNLLKYFIGEKDFYKVIVEHKKHSVCLQAFNFNGTLNQPAGKQKAAHNFPIPTLPTQIYNIGFDKDSNSTFTINMDKGWGLSLRIHSASSKIEDSLKLAVKLVGIPEAQCRENLPIT
ncbi:MAG: hypothetical protein A2297_08775 [Elusimicrobia bacterium RIFOXYB2_FULL_48_7]|nr:MAG: hypothetical protein A2297_08775 [Elusimicrobia bacterium RIFOXYB2_FULL_48_7]